ncbi:hypothetical protein LMG28688_04629 [Paraburkholderia caffeinitolerans]|uniref:Uncharacterized protein n=1 Tax=Paraburkholderia caffeinitolerans TaxID=1723730 RepID=A0A6J5GC26_9BURK|nr:hypothetical protein [Paraburkholderia caffeinitolerans]CAB3797869.1 hypothetical protein LMG28688_04629 [Paraburkholderia caffeinitolerans]
MRSIQQPQKPNAGNLLPASLADTELDHIERMIQFVTRTQGAGSPRGIDAGYWNKRLRALEQTYDLVATQRQRMARLFEMLERGKHDRQGGTVETATAAWCAL